MSNQEYKQALLKLHIPPGTFAAWVGVHPDTGKRWGRDGPPPAVAKWLRYMTATRIRPGDVDKAIRAA